MRIRKRQVPLPFSSLSPLPLSDPLLRPPVQFHRPITTTHAADAPTHFPLPSSASDPPNLHLYDFAAPPTLANLENQQQEDDDAHHTITRERSVFGAETSNGILRPQSTSSPQVVGQWCEREKAFPLKKRRGSFERPSDDQNNEDQTTTTTTVKSPDQKKTMKTKMNKKCTLPQKQEQQEDQSKLGLNLTGKKKSRGGALMEGSRCSRVNGRGWRCCQQTLVGYSLCEHHLGKGRLRSMNSVRSRSLAAAPKTVIILEEEDEKKPSPSPSPSSSPSPPPPLTLASKKRMKLGVVKARSINSLLGQPDGVMAAGPPLPPTQPDDNIH